VRPDEIRRNNLGLLLDQVHRDGDLTRAKLTQRLRLNRSTIGALVAELTDLGLVSEHVPTGSERAGRPSHVVGPRIDGPFAYAVDVEVDRVVRAAVGVHGRVLARSESRLTHDADDPARVVELIVGGLAPLSADLPAGAWPVGLGVSIPGTVRRADHRIELAPNLRWRDVSLEAMLAARVPVELPVCVGNDADLGALSEHSRGAGRGRDDLIYLNGKIGVGGGIITGGNPLPGHDGLAGEVGHMMLDASGPTCHCGGRGCAETYIGEQALLRLSGRAGCPTRESVAEVFAAARAGEPLARNGVRAVAVSLGRTVASLLNLLNPQAVIMGGSLSGILELARCEIEAEMERGAMAASRRGVELCCAALGDDSSLQGAADLAFRPLFADPIAVGQLRPVA
jgi:predicted NBD/HSP70 family sugar kinase